MALPWSGAPVPLSRSRRRILWPFSTEGLLSQVVALMRSAIYGRFLRSPAGGKRFPCP